VSAPGLHRQEDSPAWFAVIVAATCAAALGNSVASIARLLGVSRSTIYLEGFYVSQQMLRRLDSRPLT
jgi:hypothetical protein